MVRIFPLLTQTFGNKLENEKYKKYKARTQIKPPLSFPCQIGILALQFFYVVLTFNAIRKNLR